MKKIKGILFCILIAGIATVLSECKIGNFSMEIIGAPVFSILMGMMIAMVAPKLSAHNNLKDGIKFTSKKILQWAVIILGFSLNLGTIAKMGSQSLPVIISTISTSLIVAFLMMKVLKMDKRYPALSALVFPYFGQAIGFGSEGFAIFAGTAVNDTSSVTAVASTAEGLYGVEGILSSAVTVKLVRTLAIIPITLALALFRTYKAKKSGNKGSEFSFKKIFPPGLFCILSGHPLLPRL